MLFENVDKSKEPKITVTQQGVTNKPAIWFHQVDNGNTAVLCLSDAVNENLRIYIPNGVQQYTTDADGVKSVTLVTEESFNHWWQQVKNWLDSNLETTIINWVETHWDVQFQPHVNETIDKYNMKMMNDNDNSLSTNGNITYVNDPQQPRGVVPKIHDMINSVKAELNQEISDRKTEDTTIRREILEQLPVGSLLHLYRSDTVNRDVRNWYLKCDGSLIPSGSQYDKIRQYLSGNSIDFSRCNNVFDNHDITAKPSGAMPQIGYMIGKALRNRYRAKYGTSILINHPIPLKPTTAIDLLNEYFVGNYVSAVKPFHTDLPFWTLLGNNFRSTSFGGNTDRFNSTYNRATSTYVKKSGSSNSTSVSSYYSSNWWKNSIFDPDGDMSSNQVERLSHVDLYNFQLHVRRISSNSSYKTIQVMLGQSDSYTSVWEHDLELTFNVDTQAGTEVDLLLYLEIGNRETNKITHEYAILIPYEFLTSGSLTSSSNNEANIRSIFSKINEVAELTSGTPKLYGSQNYAGFSAYTSALEFVIPNPTGYDWAYMRVGGLTQGRASNIRSSDGIYYPMLHPILSYVFENPLSYYSMMHGAYRRFDGYMNYYYYNKTSAGSGLTGSWGFEGYFNRFKINTDGFLKMLGLEDIYSTEQFKDFWDDIISNCKMKGWTPTSNKYSSYPKRGGVDVYSLPSCSASDPSGFASRPAFKSPNNSWGCVYGFRSFDPRSTSYESTSTKRDDIAIKGSRTVLRINDASNLYFMTDTDATNLSRRNNRYGFILHCNGTWKDLSFYLNKVTSKGTSYGPNRMIGDDEYDSEFTWSNQKDSIDRCYESAGLCRVRIYNEGETDPWVDIMYTEFASNKTWEDGQGGGQGDYSALGNGFTVLNSGDYILSSLQNPGSMNVNIIVVIDRITNLFSCYGGNSASYSQWADAYDCFNIGWFIDYCNNNKNIELNNNEVRLPDLTKDGVFLGGGNNGGNEKKSAISNITGGFGISGSDGSCPSYGAFTSRGYGSSSHYGHSSGGGNPGAYLDASKASKIYNSTINDQLWPDHIVVETWMKYK